MEKKREKVLEQMKAKIEEMKSRGEQGAVVLLTEYSSYEDYEKAIKSVGKENVFFAPPKES